MLSVLAMAIIVISRTFFSFTYCAALYLTWLI